MAKTANATTSTTAADPEKVRGRYKEFAPLYARLGSNLVGALRTFLDEKGIPYLDVTTRVKDVESAITKVQTKGYPDPFEDIEDWCGIRIVCYYPSDVENICALVRSEFNVATEENTAGRLAPQEFGYRSTHFVLTIKDGWLEAPNYRGLRTLKAEVQVRTVLMHAWAEIEHKLAYKNQDQVPHEFKRKLYRLSAKFEEADEQFEDLRVGLAEYRKTLKIDAKDGADTLRAKELNLDALQVFLDWAYPRRKGSLQQTANLLAEISPLGITMADLVDAVEAQRPFFRELQQIGTPRATWAQVGALRNALDIANDTFYQSRIERMKKYMTSGWLERVEFGRTRLGRK